MQNRINRYLHYGYLPDKNGVLVANAGLLSSERNHGAHTPDMVSSILNESFDDLLSRFSPKGYCVVPISGGWDSRILLGAAMERFDRSQIKSVSFGVPGLLDYEMGRQISKELGIEHHSVDLSKDVLTWETLQKSVFQSPWTYVPDGYFNRLAVSQIAQSAQDLVLSGFMGDPLTGGHLSKASTSHAVLREFVNRQRRERKLKLTSPGYDPEEAISDLKEEERVSYSELLDLTFRQANCIASIVTPLRRWTGWDGDMGQMPSTGARVLAPFAHPKWASYWLGVPKELKRGQKLYLDMMRSRYPQLASLPSKYSLGADSPISRFVAKGNRILRKGFERYFPKLGLRYLAELNYLDYSAAFRERSDYLELLDRAFNYLRTREVTPWLDLDRMRRLHLNGSLNCENAFMLLIGLALNLSADAENDNCAAFVLNDGRS